MAATSYLLAMRNGLLLIPSSAGSEITLGLLPTVAGMIAGFLHGQFAGLVPVAKGPQPSSDSPTTPRTFDGPVRVRTSVAAVAIRPCARRDAGQGHVYMINVIPLTVGGSILSVGTNAPDNLRKPVGAVRNAHELITQKGNRR